MNIKLRSSNLIKKCGTANPFKLAEYLGIDVLCVPLPASIRGLYIRPLRRKIILLNDTLPYAGQSVTVCHEIGHSRMHSGYGYYFFPDRTYYVPCKREREANEYAAHLLSYSYDVDSSLLSKIINEKRPDPKIIHRMLVELIS